MRFISVVIILTACLMLAVLASVAKAHMWYDPDCCSGNDCAPVEKADYVAGALYNGPPGQASPLPVMVVTTRHGQAVLTQNTKRRASQDGQLHACIFGGRLICLYLPPGN